MKDWFYKLYLGLLTKYGSVPRKLEVQLSFRVANDSSSFVLFDKKHFVSVPMNDGKEESEV